MLTSFLWTCAQEGYKGSYGSSICTLLRNLHTDFYHGCTKLHSYQKRIKVPLHPYQHLWLFVVLMVVILTGVRWNLIVLLICISVWKWTWTFLHVFIRPLYFFWELSVQFICPFINWIACSFWSSLLFWILIHYLMDSWHRFSPNLWVVSSFW
jgi:hypothetical protein